MRTVLLTAAVILTVRTLVLATASSLVMATAGAVFAERASATLQTLAVATPSPPHPSDPNAQMAAAPSPATDWRNRPRLAQGWHPSAESNRTSAA